MIEDIDARAWATLADEAGYSLRFARTTTASTIERVMAEAEKLADLPRHRNETVAALIEGIGARSS